MGSIVSSRAKGTGPSGPHRLVEGARESEQPPAPGPLCDVVRSLWLCSQDFERPLPLPLPGGRALRAAAAGTYGAAALAEDGSVWAIGDGSGRGIAWRPLDCSAAYVSCHDDAIVALSAGDRAVGFGFDAIGCEPGLYDSDEDAGEEAWELRLLSGKGLVEVVGHFPEHGLVARSAAGAVWAFGAYAPGSEAAEVGLPELCEQLACGRQQAVARLRGGDVCVFGPAGVRRLEIHGISQVAAGCDVFAAVARADGAVYTWGRCPLHGNGAFGEAGYSGDLARPTRGGPEEDAEADPEPGLCPGLRALGAACSPAGNLTFSQPEGLLRPFGGVRHRGPWASSAGSASPAVLPTRYHCFVCADLPRQRLRDALREELHGLLGAVRAARDHVAQGRPRLAEETRWRATPVLEDSEIWAFVPALAEAGEAVGLDWPREREELCRAYAEIEGSSARESPEEAEGL